MGFKSAGEEGFSEVFPPGWCAGTWPSFSAECLPILRWWLPKMWEHLQVVCDRLTRELEAKRAGGQVWCDPFGIVLRDVPMSD